VSVILQIDTHNNQLKVGVDDGGEPGRTRGRGGTCGGTPYRQFGRQINSTKIMREEDGAMAVGRRHSMKGHNNLPYIGVRNGDDRRATVVERVWGAFYLRLGRRTERQK
jgi:hypothetical protein